MGVNVWQLNMYMINIFTLHYIQHFSKFLQLLFATASTVRANQRAEFKSFCNFIGWHGSHSCNQTLQELGKRCNKRDRVLCCHYSHMHIANDIYACRCDESTPPALCLGTLAPRQKQGSRVPVALSENLQHRITLTSLIEQPCCQD